MIVHHTHIRLLLLFFAFGFLAFLMPQTLRAQDTHRALTKSNITDFIQRTSDITSGAMQDMSTEDIVEYLENHLDQKARFKSLIKYNVPGHPPQETALSMNKTEFIESVKAGVQTVSEYETTIEVHSVKISKDKTKATVRTTGVEKGVMAMSANGTSSESIPIEGSSACTQTLSLNKDGVIQMYNANCETTISFQP